MGGVCCNDDAEEKLERFFSEENDKTELTYTRHQKHSSAKYDLGWHNSKASGYRQDKICDPKHKKLSPLHKLNVSQVHLNTSRSQARSPKSQKDN